MFRSFAIVATAFGGHLDALKNAGVVGTLSVFIGIVLSFAVGAAIAVAWLYRRNCNQRGRPMGMQFIGQSGEDVKVLEFALAYEAVTDHLATRPVLQDESHD